MPKEGTFPIPLKYIEVTRSTHTDLDLLQVKRIDDYWNFDSSKHLSDSLRGFTKFTLLREKPAKWIFVVRRATDKVSNNYQTRLCLQMFGQNWSTRSESRNKPEWAKEKPKLDNAPKLRGIYFVDPEDREYSEDILKNTSWKDLWHQPCHAKDPSIVKTSTKPKIGQETEINHNV